MFSPLDLGLTNPDVKHYVPSLMTARAYISNISPLWPVERQEEALRAACGYPDGVTVFRDELTVKERKAHQSVALIQRTEMLRPSTRQTSGTIYIASLAVLDWSAEGMLEAVTLAMARNTAIRVVDAGITIEPRAKAPILHKAAVAFAAARKRAKETERGKAGGEASARKRSAQGRAGALSIKDEWKLDEPPTDVLLARAGISRNTAILHLGLRSAAQRHHRAAQKRKAKRE